MGIAATAFIRAMGLAEKVFERIPHDNLRHAIGMLLIGALIYGLLTTFGHYYVAGVGYATIQDILTGGLAAPGLLTLLFVAKLFATSVSLGSGSSGGIFCSWRQHSAERLARRSRRSISYPASSLRPAP